MSGFFMIRSDLLRRLALGLSGIGFKILLDIFVTAPKPLRFMELPYRFRARSLGTSKMDAKVVLEFFELLIDKMVGHIVPAKFVIFALVGSLGVVVHLFVLTLTFKDLGFDFESSQIVATLVAMTSNLGGRGSEGGSVLPWRHQSARSPMSASPRICSGSSRPRGFLSAVAGVLIGVVWNYTVTALFTWKRG